MNLLADSVLRRGHMPPFAISDYFTTSAQSIVLVAILLPLAIYNATPCIFISFHLYLKVLEVHMCRCSVDGVHVRSIQHKDQKNFDEDQTWLMYLPYSTGNYVVPRAHEHYRVLYKDHK